VRIAITTVMAGLILVVALGTLDEWVASPLQQRGAQLRNAALAISGEAASPSGSIWARRGDEVARIGSLSRDNMPVNIEIFQYTPDRFLKSYVFAERAEIGAGGTWVLKNAHIKEWDQAEESIRQQDSLVWQSVFADRRLKELTLPPDSFSIRQLRRYIQFLDASHQPSAEYQMAMWQKLGRPLLTLAMILFAVPFTFAQPRSPGLGGRLAVGAVVGLLIYVGNQIIANLGLLLAGNVMLTTLLPSGALLGIALWLIYRFDRVR
jgi:lipopolysaccharide export system permease protein